MDQTRKDQHAAPPPSVVRLAAPLAGWLMAIDEVSDPVFSGRVLGDGFAIDPVDQTLFAPCDGVITSIHRAHHAVTLRADNGAEILMHIGLDTVALQGKGFEVHVAQGDRVATGDPLIGFDLDALALTVKSLVVPLILTNGDVFRLYVPCRDREVFYGEIVAELRPIDDEAPQVEAPTSTPVTTGPAFRTTATVTDPHGIHARPAGLLAEAAKSFDAEVKLSIAARSTTAGARSPVALMLLGATQGDLVDIEATGPQAEVAARRIAALVGEPGEKGAPAPVAVAVEAPTPVVATPAAPAFAADARVELDGVCAAPGVAVGVAFRMQEEALDIPEAGADVAQEAEALRGALRTTATAMRADLAGTSGQQADILAAHLAFVEDLDLQHGAETLIRDGKSAAYAWKATIDRQVVALRRIGNPVLAERAADLEDVCHRVLLVILGRDGASVDLPEAAVLFADDLLPSRLTTLDATRIAGICLARGGPTSHVAIIAASKGIPTVVAIGPDALRVPDGATVVIDADKALVRINPPAEQIEATRRSAERRRKAAAANHEATHTDCRMADGTRIEVVANLGGPADVAVALENGAEGCGLMRSEFLFLNRTAAPSEEEQFMQYQQTATALGGRPLIIRTLDAGADKDVPYAGLPQEENPSLGLRGVRIGLLRPDLVATQIRAILRVEPFGQVRILLPMVATLDDLRQVRTVIDREMAALGRTAPIEVGIMVEVPSAALLSGLFAAEVDFFSIGTNDLTQYTLAMDRMNARLAKQLDPFHPAVLKLIALTVEGARSHGRWVGVCGSLASFPLAAPLLVGLGVSELSATAGSISEIKALVRTLTLEQCQDVARRALALESGAAVRRLLTEIWPEY